MKRDMDLIRNILQSVQDSELIGVHEGYNEQAIAHHTRLLIQAKFITFNKLSNSYEMTWDGYEILEGLGTDDEWNSIKLSCIRENIPINRLSWETISSLVLQSRIGAYD